MVTECIQSLMGLNDFPRSKTHSQAIILAWLTSSSHKHYYSQWGMVVVFSGSAGMMSGRLLAADEALQNVPRDVASRDDEDNLLALSEPKPLRSSEAGRPRRLRQYVGVIQ